MNIGCQLVNSYLALIIFSFKALYYHVGIEEYAQCFLKPILAFVFAMLLRYL